MTISRTALFFISNRAIQYIETSIFLYIGTFDTKSNANLDTHRDNVLGEDEGPSTEADHAAVTAGLSHVDVVVGVALQARVVHLSHSRAVEADNKSEPSR